MCETSSYLTLDKFQRICVCVRGGQVFLLGSGQDKDTSGYLDT